MITAEQLKIFYKYNGDSDGFISMGTMQEKETFTSQTWALIEDLVSDLFLIYNTKVTEEFIKDANLKLTYNCDSTTTIESLHNYASKPKD